MTRDEWRAQAREHLASRPKYEPITQGRLQAMLHIARSAQKEAGDEALLETAALWPDWRTGQSYVAGDVLNYGERLYRVVLAHTSQADWAPDRAVNLFTAVQTAQGTATLSWITGELVVAGDLRVHAGQTYRCLQTHTTVLGWEPPNVPALWKAVLI